MDNFENPIEEKLENQFILRLPPKYAAKIKKYLRTKPKKVKKNLQLMLDPETREAQLTLKNKTIQMKLVDLPTIVESLKTINSKVFFKTADISQMLIVDNQKHKGNPSAVIVKKKEENKWKWPHGLTPPLKNVQQCRYRKILMNPQRTDSIDISKELKWLLQMDTEAVEVRWELVDDPTYKVKNETICHPTYLNEEMLFGEIISDSDDDDCTIIEIGTSQGLYLL